MKQITQLFLSQNPLIAMLNQRYFPLISFIVLIILTYSGNVLGQTTVFTDNFNVSVTPIASTWTSTTSTPAEMVWTAGYQATSQGQIQTKGIDPEFSVQISSNATQAVVGRDYLIGSLSTFSAPFTSTLKNNTGDVNWTFNMGTSRAISPLATAFDAGAFWGSAVILAMSGTNPTDAATNGYAVVMTQGASTGEIVFSLVRFSNGLTASANITSIIGTSSSLVARANWRSIKVIYTPGTDTWKLYVREEAVSASSATAPDPSSGTLTQVGSATVDNTYTSVAMSSCGLFLNHSNNAASTNWTRYDNFKMVVDDAPITFTSGWPKIENVTSSGFTTKTNASIAGTSYFVVLPAGATAPSTAQVKAGQDASGASLASNLKGTIACALAATEYTVDITGLTSETTYDVYFAAENLAGNNLQAAPTKVTTTTSITTSISSLNQSIKAFVKDNKIVVLDAKGQNLLISTLTGQLINNEMLISDNQSFILNKGLYVVRISNQRIKVWIK